MKFEPEDFDRNAMALSELEQMKADISQLKKYAADLEDQLTEDVRSLTSQIADLKCEIEAIEEKINKP